MTTKSEKPDKPADQAADQPAPIEDNIVQREHTITLNGEAIDYRSIVGTLVQKDYEQDKPKSSIFFTAYFKQGVADPADRPLLICFNGGPGSSSIWLHMGMLGPRRALSGDVGNQLPPPYGLTDNEYSLLDVADMLFIDPVSTGYSRPAPGEEAKQFHGLEPDLESVGEFIRLFITRYDRWLSPKYLVGESYGTTRAAGLAGHLQTRHGIYLNGLALISMVLDFQTLVFNENNELPYVLFLPTYAATAWYHGQIADDAAPDLETLLAEVEAFAQSEYAAALFQGAALPPAQRADIIARLARYTGLSEAYIDAAELRPEIFRFTRELLRDQRRTVGRLDSRFTGMERDAVGERISYDPSYPPLQGSYTAAFNDYVRRELGYRVDLPYEALTSLYEKWSYDKHKNRFAEVAETLRSAMTQNPALKVYVACGYYDLATPYFAAEYTLNHLMLDPTLRANISQGYFPAGHMMYVHPESLARVNEDVRALIRNR
ncbi:MAG: peptidase S10 [Caldilineaceae bacterium]|nr:peptidase S10 [Caldilineaceae bacterium]